jgi:hypothetical protein
VINNYGTLNEGWALVQKEGKYGFIDDLGKEIVPPIYNKIGGFG